MRFVVYFLLWELCHCQWYDASMFWDPAKYGGLYHVMTSYQDVWVPELILTNPAEGSDTLGKKWQRVYFDYSGFASWWPGDLIKSTCTIDVYKYPFDTQECTLTFAVWGYFSGMIYIYSVRKDIDLELFTKSSTWTLTKSEAKTTYDNSQIAFTVSLKRKPDFVIVNVILPLTFLSLLNAFVFLLLPESGERISYCITVMLSIAVFMTIVSDTLPESSQPVPVISYKLMVDMVTSALITIVTILNLRVHNRADKNVPNWLKILYILLSCRRSNIHPKSSSEVPDMQTNRKQSIFKNDGETIQEKKQNESENTSERTICGMSSISMFNPEEKAFEPVQDTLVKMMSDIEQDLAGKPEVTWKNISNMLDGIAFLMFTLISVCSVGGFFVTTF